MPFIVDTSMAPIYKITCRDTITIPETEDYLQTMTGWLKQHKIVSIIKTENLERTNRALVKIWADWFAANDQLCRERSLGNVFIFDSMIHRFVLSSLLLVVKLPMPYHIASNMDDAIKWSKKTLQKGGGSVPSII
jgi:hypothetical protein